MNLVLLLTSTVYANDDGLTSITYSNIRLSHYLKAINFYLVNTSLDIVVVDNSNFDFSKQIDLKLWENRIEILHFEGNNYDLKLGKGYGEMNIIEFALENSLKIRNNDNCFILKNTGRLILLNIKQHLKQFKYLEYPEKAIVADLTKDLTIADSRFFGASVNFYRNYIYLYKEIIRDSQGVYFEHAFAKSILSAIINGYSYETFKKSLNFKGQSGSKGTSYNTNFLKVIYKDLNQKFKYQFFKNA